MNTVAWNMVDIAVVDDHNVVRMGLQNWLETFPFVREVQLFSSSIELYQALEETSVAAVLLDIELRGENGFDVCSMIKKKYPQLPVIIMSGHTEEHYVWQANKRGASGYIFKDEENFNLEAALEKVIFEGGQHFTALSPQTMNRYERKAFAPVNSFGQTLTEREVEILLLICEGFSNKEIAVKLVLEETTIATHRKNLRKKIKAHNTADMINFARKSGILPATGL